MADQGQDVVMVSMSCTMRRVNRLVRARDDAVARADALQARLDKVIALCDEWARDPSERSVGYAHEMEQAVRAAAGR